VKKKYFNPSHGTRVAGVIQHIVHNKSWENSKSTVALASALFHRQVHFFVFFYIQVFLPNF
jgi:hypothetical protein